MKKKIFAISILLMGMVLAVVATLFVNKQMNKSKKQEKKTEVEVTAQLPKVRVYYGEDSVGSLSGYTMKMKTERLRDNLAVVKADDRKLYMDMSSEGVYINSASYEVKTNNGKRLIDSGDISEITEGVCNSSFYIDISAILENNMEYLIIVTLNTEEFGEIYYYSRLMVVADEFLSAQITFAKDFSNSTMDDTKASGLVIYMEPDSTLLNNNLGMISLKNSYDLITWGNLASEKITDTEIELKEVYVKDTGFSGTYQMKYQIQAEGNNEIIETYDIVETITVWTFAERQYVLAYERTMEQVWEANENNIRNSFIDLGIQIETEADYVENVEGSYIAYTVNGQLWIVDITEHKLTKIYEIENKDGDATKILLSSVDEEGNVDYIVCGYQTSVAHRGMNGISVCRYNYDDNYSTERIFVPQNEPASILSSQIEKLCYMNDEVLYLAIEDVVYYVNLITKENGKLTENLQDGNYAINEDKNTIAYHTEGGLYDSDSITVSNLSDNTNSIIEAGIGNKIKICGYAGNHLVYGIAPESEIYIEKGQMNMSTVKVLNEKLEELVSYGKEKVFVTNVEITDSIINLKRTKNGKELADDQLIDNTEKKEVLVTSSYYDDTKKYRELAIALEINIGAVNEVILEQATGKNVYTQLVDIVDEKEGRDLYYVYACGALREISDNRQLAEQIAKGCDGLVVNSMGEKVWTFEENYE